MSDISNITTTAPSPTPSTHTTTAAQSSKEPVVTTKQEVKQDNTEEILEKASELTNVVSVSKDGDTVQVSPEGNETFADENSMSVTPRMVDTTPVVMEEETVNFEVEAPAEEDAPTPNIEITSYAGITNQQLEQLYLDGIISRYDYETELSDREAILEAASGNDKAHLEKMMGYESSLNKTENTAQAISTAYSTEKTSYKPQTAENVLQAMENITF